MSAAEDQHNPFIFTQNCMQCSQLASWKYCSYYYSQLIKLPIWFSYYTATLTHEPKSGASYKLESFMPFLLLQTPHLVSKLPLCFAEQEMGRSSFAPRVFMEWNRDTPRTEQNPQRWCALNREQVGVTRNKGGLWRIEERSQLASWCAALIQKVSVMVSTCECRVPAVEPVFQAHETDFSERGSLSRPKYHTCMVNVTMKLAFAPLVCGSEMFRCIQLWLIYLHVYS